MHTHTLNLEYICTATHSAGSNFYSMSQKPSGAYRGRLEGNEWELYSSLKLSYLLDQTEDEKMSYTVPYIQHES